MIYHTLIIHSFILLFIHYVDIPNLFIHSPVDKSDSFQFYVITNKTSMNTHVQSSYGYMYSLVFCKQIKIEWLYHGVLICKNSIHSFIHSFIQHSLHAGYSMPGTIIKNMALPSRNLQSNKGNTHC